MTIDWVSQGKFFINQLFYNYGIVVVKTHISKGSLITNEIISHNDRFLILPIEKLDKNLKYVNKQSKFFRNLVPNSLNNQSDVDISSDLVLYNSQRRTEIFLPFSFKKEKISIYIYAWVSKSIKDKSISFDTVDNFITAGCIFGSRLKAMDEISKNLFTFIRMDMDFFSDKKINSISLESLTLSTYELFLFNELEREAKLIYSLSSKAFKKNLIYHFPYYDYIIFASILLVRDILSYEAFDSFYQIILKSSDFYIARITNIFQVYDINVKIESPYQNIFGSLDFRSNYTTDDILKQLDIVLDEINKSSGDPIEEERKLIQNCWNKLSLNSLDLNHQQIWNFFSNSYNLPPNSFKQLLECANTMMIARASWEKEQYTTCSLLPHSEKQIQIGYSKLLKSYPSKTFLDVINLTIFDPAVAYSNEENIGLFSCDVEIKNIGDMIHSSRRNQFFNAHKNLNTSQSDDLKTETKLNL
jgi:hypothetical protein